MQHHNFLIQIELQILFHWTKWWEREEWHCLVEEEPSSNGRWGTGQASCLLYGAKKLQVLVWKCTHTNAVGPWYFDLQWKQKHFDSAAEALRSCVGVPQNT